MQILFLDESGSLPPPPGGRRRFFVLGGVIVAEGAWHAIKAELDAAKAQHSIHGEIKWRYFSPHNNDSDNSMAHLDGPARVAVREEIYRIITRRKSVKVIAAVADIKMMYGKGWINTAEELYQQCYKPLTERFQYYLQDIARETGTESNGIVICDHRERKQDNHLRRLHQDLMDWTAPFSSNYGNVIEGLFLAPSHYSVGIQLADMVAGGIYRHFESGDSRHFLAIEGSFRKRPNGSINGFGLVKLPHGQW